MMMMITMLIITFTSRINVSGYLVCANLFRQLLPKNLLPQEPKSRSMQLRCIFIDWFIFRSNLPGMRLPWECHDQSQEPNWHHWVTRPELPFFHKRKDILKIGQSAKRPWHRSCMLLLTLSLISSVSDPPTWWPRIPLPNLPLFQI